MKPARKKLLVAAVGVAALNYVGACTSTTSGNLMAPDPSDAAADADVFITSGNLMAPPDAGATDADAGKQDSGGDAQSITDASSD
ncbi:MAG: hypothetical protein U0174_00815 [Polyangiaceae bacterium]